MSEPAAKGEPETYWDMVRDPDCVVRVRNLTHYYGRNRALASVNFTVRRGDIFGLVGPNGAGKTTLLKILATLVLPSKGQAYIMHHSVRKRAHYVRINIGFMPDSTGIKEDLTVWEYLNFYGALYRVENMIRAQVIREALDLVGLARRERSN
ncbi:MAG: ATP-binding cassette domain-containing protein [Planctomycetota bacterium]|jgi:ABC-2 type transport system ATP-binding protein